MPSKKERLRRSRLVKAMAQDDINKAIEKMPISIKNLAALFDQLDEVLGNEGCDHTPKITRTFFEEQDLDFEKILPWLEEQGGYCDCEILANVEEKWESEIAKNT